MKKKNIIQFMPYFPPHVGGVEKVGEDIFLKWTYGESYVISGEIEEKGYVYNEDISKNIDRKKYIGYPSFDIVDNFPIPLIWTRKYKYALNQIKKIIQENPNEEYYIITHTRFFLSSFLGGRFAKKHNVKWIHIEHGSDYVKLSSRFKNKIAYFYDKSIGRYIFKKADTVLAISKAAENFVKQEFLVPRIITWYRGVDVPEIEDKLYAEIKIVFVGRLVHLKGVDILLEALSKSKIDNTLTIFGDGEERNNLKSLSQKLGINNRVDFRGFVDSNEIRDYVSKNKCILVNPSYQEGMPTTIIEALATKNIVIASDVGGTKEISDNEDLILFPSGDVAELTQELGDAIKKYSDFEGKSYTHIYENFSWDKSLKQLYNYL